MLDAFLSFWGLAFTIVCGAVGCFKLPPAFSNSWRLGIFVGLLVCYVIGYFNGMKKKSLERDTGRESAKAVFEAQISAKDKELAGARAAIDNEKRKNALLASRWEDLHSEGRRKREVFDVLSEREKWCLSHVVDDWPKKHSAAGSVILASYDVLTRAGILVDQGEEELGGQVAHTYTIALEWRGWIFDHSGELPEPNLTMPE